MLNKLLLSIMVLFVCCHVAFSQDKAPDDNIYTNKMFGFSIVKPNDWRFTTIEDHAKSLSAVELKDKDLQDALVKYSNAPVVGMMKHAEPFEDINPSFTIKIRPMEGFDAEDPKSILNLVFSAMPKMFENFAIIVPPENTLINGQLTAYGRISYKSVYYGQPFFVTSQLWIVPLGNYYLIMGGGVRTDEATGSIKELESIANTLILQSDD